MKFSIGIPAYKASFLKECIDSIIDQTYSEFELIIINDASPEDINSIVTSYNDERIKYYKNEKNFGAEHVVDNWNKCLSIAKGDYFVLMGDDDMMESNYLEEFIKLIEKYPYCNVYHCRSIIIDENSTPIKLTDPRPEFESVYDSILQRIQGKRVFYISDYIYKTDVLKNNGGFYKLPLAWASDDISSYIASIKYGIAHTNELLFKYRKNAKTISLTGNRFLKMDAIIGEESWLNNFIIKKTESKNDSILQMNIRNEIRKYIQKRKVNLIAASIIDKGYFSFLFWYKVRIKYSFSTDELFYALLMSFKERKKNRYTK